MGFDEDVSDEGDDDEDAGEEHSCISSPGARTSHLPSLCASATRETLRLHCSRIARSLSPSIHPKGMSTARIVRVVITLIEDGKGYLNSSKNVGDDIIDRESVGGVKFLDMISSVAPTVQWPGYTGTAYVRTSLYAVGDGVDKTRAAGG